MLSTRHLLTQYSTYSLAQRAHSLERKATTCIACAYAMEARHDLLFDADAHHSDGSDTSSDTIEMAGLEEIPVTPARRNDYAPPPYDGPRDSDDESDGDDAGEQALLGAHSRTRGRERPQDGKPTVFHQVKRIVIEVSLLRPYTLLCPSANNIYRLLQPLC